MDTAMKHHVPDRVKPSFVILTSGHSDAQGWASECPDVKKYKWRLNPVWHMMLYSCTHMATVGVKGLRKYRSGRQLKMNLTCMICSGKWSSRHRAFQQQENCCYTVLNDYSVQYRRSSMCKNTEEYQHKARRTSWNKTEIKQNCLRSAVSFQPTTGSIVLRQFYFRRPHIPELLLEFRIR